MTKRRAFKKKWGFGNKRLSRYVGAGYQLYKDVKKLKSLINTEFKEFNTTTTGTASSSGTVAYHTLVPTGDTEATRDGSMFRVKSFSLRLDLQADSAHLYPVYVRVIIGIHKQVNGTALSMADILQASGSGSVIVRHKQDDNSKLITILKDMVFVLNPQVALVETGGTVSDVAYNRRFYKYYKKLDMHTKYSASNTDGAITGCENNAIFTMIATNASATQPDYEWSSRIKFIDN